MNADDAKTIVLAYLTGNRVPAKSLHEACARVRDDAACMDRLRDELGLSHAWTSVCTVFLSRLAELSELAPDARAAEFPEFAEHLGACPACRRQYWRVATPWAPVAGGAADSAGERTTTLCCVKPIVVALDAAGRLSAPGDAPSPTREEPVAAAAGGPLPWTERRAGDEPKVWVLDDETSHCAVRLAVSRKSADEVAVRCRIDWDPGAAGTEQDARIEALHAESGASILAGPLSEFRDRPVILTSGAWTIRIEARALGRCWEIPLTVRVEPADGRPAAAPVPTDRS